MKSINEFKVKQRVSQWDEDEGKRVFGVVTKVNIEQENVEIEWDDLTDSTTHYDDEFESIKPA